MGASLGLKAAEQMRQDVAETLTFALIQSPTSLAVRSIPCS